MATANPRHRYRRKDMRQDVLLVRAAQKQTLDRTLSNASHAFPGSALRIETKSRCILFISKASIVIYRTQFLAPGKVPR